MIEIYLFSKKLKSLLTYLQFRRAFTIYNYQDQIQQRWVYYYQVLVHFMNHLSKI